MEKVPTEELNRLLMHFFHKLKPNGEDYEPETRVTNEVLTVIFEMGDR